MACASPYSKPEPTYKGGPQAKVYYASFDEVWGAAQKVLAKYPMRVNNIDVGLLETDVIKYADAYRPPFTDGGVPSGLRYKIILRVIKGNVRGRGSIKVTVEKVAEVQKDFFAAPEEKISDGWEEKLLIYRIGREITIQQAIEKAQEQSQDS